MEKKKGIDPQRPHLIKMICGQISHTLSTNCNCCTRKGSGSPKKQYSQSPEIHLMEEKHIETGKNDNGKSLEIEDQDPGESNGIDPEAIIPEGDSMNHEFDEESGPLRKDITKKSAPWTKKDDELLISLVEKYKGKHWRNIAKSFQGRLAPDCKMRWRVLRPNTRRKPWDQKEDKLLNELIKVHGNDWAAISAKMKGRNGKQVRERFLNTLDPCINREKWSKQEDKIILSTYYQIGTKWSEIAKVLKNRPENMVKNRFYSHIKKNMVFDDETESEAEEMEDEQSLPSQESIKTEKDKKPPVPVNSGPIVQSSQAPVGRTSLFLLEDEIGEDFSAPSGMLLEEEEESERKTQEIKGNIYFEPDYLRTVSNDIVTEKLQIEVEKASNSPEPMEEESKGSDDAKRSQGSSGDSSITGFLDMSVNQSPEDTLLRSISTLEFAIQEADDKMKQAYYLLSNQLKNGAAMDIASDITKTKMFIDALKNKRSILEDIRNQSCPEKPK